MLEPEKRPFPIRAYNGISKTFGWSGKLDFDQLIKKSRRQTGLQDFGSDFNAEALQIMIKSINHEAQLHPFGMLMIREKLIGQLENRLWATHWFAKYPEILLQELLPIALITGLQRTGTTKMQRLLSSHPHARGLMSWEALYPAPIGAYGERNKRIGRTKRNERAVKWISPAFQSIHPIHADQPEEDVLLLDVHFMSTSSEAIMHVPTYADWLSQQDQTEVYAYEKKLLKLLQWQRSGKFWVLKSPHHLEFLDAFKTVFPESTILWMHRSVSACIPSFLNMLYISRGMFCAHVDEKDIKGHWINKLYMMIENGLAFRENSKASIIDVEFDHFVNDEKEVMENIYAHLKVDTPLDKEQGLNKKYISKHEYRLSDWDLNEDDLKQRFASYEALITTLKNTKNP